MDRKHSFYGIPTGTQPGGGGTVWVCQSCGYGFTHQPTSLVGFLFVPVGLMFFGLGGILALTGLAAFQWWLFGIGLAVGAAGAGLLANALWPGFLLWRNPVAPGAPTPEIRWRSAEQPRRCTCGAPAPCVEVTVNRTNGVHTGTERVYACVACGRRFTVESGLGVGLMLGAGLFFVGLAAVMVPESDEWDQLACAASLGALGLGGIALGLYRIVTALRHPSLPRS